MDLVQLKPTRLRVTDSCFQFPLPEPDLLVQRERHARVLRPFLVQQRQQDWHLASGFARFQRLLIEEHDTLPCLVLEPGLLPLELFRLLLEERAVEFTASIAARSSALGLAEALAVSEQDALDELLPMLGFQAHARVLRQCRRVAALPPAVLEFCHRKQFSLKQCFHLSRQPVDLLNTLFARADRLHLTASILEELLDNLSDWLKITGKSAGDLDQDREFLELFQPGLHPQGRTRALRQLLHQRRFPTLNASRAKLTTLQAELGWPPEMSLQWDSSLEQHELRIQLLLSNPDQWSMMLDNLALPRTRELLAAMLEEL